MALVSTSGEQAVTSEAPATTTATMMLTVGWTWLRHQGRRTAGAERGGMGSSVPRAHSSPWSSSSSDALQCPTVVQMSGLFRAVAWCRRDGRDAAMLRCCPARCAAPVLHHHAIRPMLAVVAVSKSKRRCCAEALEPSVVEKKREQAVVACLRGPCPCLWCGVRVAGERSAARSCLQTSRGAHNEAQRRRQGRAGRQAGKQRSNC